MGTWAAGPFSNDLALDFVGGLAEQLAGRIDAFLKAPRIDEGFDEAFAALAVLNLLCAGPGAPPKLERLGAWRKGLLACFDDQIDELEPDDAYKRDQRAAIVKELEALDARAKDFWR